MRFWSIFCFHSFPSYGPDFINERRQLTVILLSMYLHCQYNSGMCKNVSMGLINWLYDHINLNSAKHVKNVPRDYTLVMKTIEFVHDHGLCWIAVVVRDLLMVSQILCSPSSLGYTVYLTSLLLKRHTFLYICIQMSFLFAKN